MNHNYLDMAFDEIGPQLEAAESKAGFVKLLKAYLESCINDLDDKFKVQSILCDIQSYVDNKALTVSEDKKYMHSLSRFYSLYDSKTQ